MEIKKLINNYQELIYAYKSEIEQLQHKIYELTEEDSLIDKSALHFGDGSILPIRSREFINCNILKATAGSNGLHGGDTGHGGRTYFEIRDMSSTDMSIYVKAKNGKKFEADVSSFSVMLGGDAELITITEALKFISRELERIVLEGYDRCEKPEVKIQQATETSR